MVMSEQPTEKQKNFLTQRKVPIPATKAEATAVIGKIINPDGEPVTTTPADPQQTTIPLNPSPAIAKNNMQDCEDLNSIETTVIAFFANKGEHPSVEKIGMYVKLIWMGRHA